MFTKAYSPEQSALGTLDNQAEIMILYIREFKTEANRVNQLENKTFSYNWFHNPKESSYVLQAFWSEDLHLAIKFEQQHFALLANLIEPRTIILSSVPISQLIVDTPAAKERVSLELSEDVITLSNIIFEDPQSFYN